MSSKHDYFTIKAAADPKIADIHIYDQIGEFWGEGIGAKRFAEELNALGKLDAINLYINSPGGSVFEGVTIYNVLKRNPATVNTKIDGVAASIASVIAMAGDTIEIADNGMFMVHDPWVYAMGNARDLREQAEVLDKVGNTLVRTYVERTGLDEAKVRELMAAESWLEADEAIDLGFAEAKSGPVRMAACIDPSKFAYRNVPDRLKVEASGEREREDRPTADEIKVEIAELNHFLSKSRVAHNHPLAK